MGLELALGLALVVATSKDCKGAILPSDFHFALRFALCPQICPLPSDLPFVLRFALCSQICFQICPLHLTSYFALKFALCPKICSFVLKFALCPQICFFVLKFALCPQTSTLPSNFHFALKFSLCHQICPLHSDFALCPQICPQILSNFFRSIKVRWSEEKEHSNQHMNGSKCAEICYEGTGGGGGSWKEGQGGEIELHERENEGQ